MCRVLCVWVWVEALSLSLSVCVCVCVCCMGMIIFVGTLLMHACEPLPRLLVLHHRAQRQWRKQSAPKTWTSSMLCGLQQLQRCLQHPTTTPFSSHPRKLALRMIPSNPAPSPSLPFPFLSFPFLHHCLLQSAAAPIMCRRRCTVCRAPHPARRRCHGPG